MEFTRQAGAAVMLVVLTLWLQCAGMALLIDWARNSLAKGLRAFTRWRSAMLMIRFTTTMIILHVVEIVLWASFYRWKCLPTWESSFYFSAASYSTVGYGDVVLPPIWRLLGPIESVIGVLMSGISVSALFAILVRLIQDEDKTSNRARRREAFEDQVDDPVGINDVAQ